MKSTKRKGNREIYWIIGIMAVILGILYLSQIIAEEFRTFNYQGLTFTKERFEKIPVFHYYYFFNNDGQTYKYNLFLREDPRFNNVPVSGNIVFSGERMIFLSINGTGISQCGNSSREIATLTSFFVNNMFNFKAGTPDKKEAEQKNLSFISCKTNPLSDVILIQKGDSTDIKREGSCYKINIADCELLNAIEKFEVQSIIDAKKRSGNS
ncbi:hypothetical protein HYW75_04000 [Candidatus Pacearchaeota archaeon]|nr:hypothetical protein [Candidatus Pacearchaeota archaeon]